MSNFYKVILSVTLLMFSWSVGFGQQDQNLAVTGATVNPAPMQFPGGSGTASFNFDATNGATLIPGEEILITVCSSNIAFSGPPTGSGASLFSWAVDPFASNCYVGTRTTDLPTLSGGPIEFAYTVLDSSTQALPGNGFNVNLTPHTRDPSGDLDDDSQVFTYTFVPDPCLSTTISFNIVSTDPTNVSNNDGTATVSPLPSGGLAPYNYLWSGGTNPTTSSVSDLTPGSYDVVVTDDNGCSATQSVVINAFTCNSTIDITFAQTNVNCFGGNTGTATATATGGNSPYTYSWSNGQMVATATNLSAGVYTVTATDANGCSADESVVITEPNEAVSVSIISTDPNGPATNDGTATATVSGGTPGYTYSWNTSPVQTTQTASGLAPGTYCVTITDTLGCTTQGCVVINLPSCNGLALVVVSSSDATCNGSSDGTATVNATGGTGPFTYSWSPGALTGSVQSALSAGNYVVTVTDGTTACTSQTLVSISQPSVLSAGVAISHVSCNGGSDGSLDLTVSGGTGPYTFVWADGPATEDRAGLSAGAYMVTVSDANGCSVVVNATVNEPATSISINTTVVDATDAAGCDDGSATATATGGTGTLTFLWDSSPAQTTATAVNLTNGIYNVIVTDGNGCTATQSVVVNCVVECDDTVGISGVTDVLCFGGSTGAATASAGSANNPSTTYTYAWSGPGGYSATGATITSLAAGTYTVIATPSTSCATVSESVVIDEPAVALSVSATSTDESGPTTNDGTATAVAIGGTPNYTYSWNSSPVQTTAVATGLDEGTYVVTVTDANGCIATATTVVNPGTCNNLAVTGTSMPVSCEGGMDGVVTANVTGGSGTASNLSYLWDDGSASTTQTVTGLSAGTYTVTVTDAGNGCTVSTAVTIGSPSVLSAGVAINHVLCNGGSDGSLDVTVSGGTGPYTFVWADGPATEDRAGLSAGAYMVTVSDANGCSVVVNATVNEPATSISINTTVVDATDAAGCDDGSATATATGGTGTLTFLWDSSPAQTTAAAVNLTNGIYNVIVTDGNGCTATQSVVVNCVVECDDTVGISGVTDVLCFGGSTGAATASAGSANNPSTTYTYAWSGPGGYSATGATITSLAAGTYTVIATPSTSCATVSESVVIDEPAVALSVSATSTDESGPTTNDGTATAVAIGGTPNYTYSWNSSPVQTTAVATGLDEGTYVVTVTDANGCIATATTVVNPGTCNNLAVTGTSMPVSCEGGMDGVVTANVTGGSGTASNLSYLWDDGSASTTQTVTGLSAGTYTVTVTDAGNGCTVSTAVTIGSPSVLSAGVAINHVLCNGGSDGSLDVTVSGGTGPYTFVWADGPATEDRAGLSAGAYSVVVTDANGCMVTVNATVNEPATSISINTTVVDATDVAGCDDGSATATATGGTGTLTFLWDSSPAQTTATAVNLTNGIYNVIVTDGNGCTATQSVVVDCVVECDDTVGITGVTDVLCFGESTGSATVTAGSANNPSTTYTYAWSGPGGYSATGATVSSLAAGTYTVIATPSTSCATVSESVVIDEPTAPLTLSTSSTAEQGPTTNDGTATVTAMGGTPGYTYVWTPNVSTTNTATGLDEGNYNVTVTDANGCTATATITVLGSTCNNLSVSAVGSLLDCVGDSDGTAVATATGGTGILSYSWNTLPAQGTATATNLSEGNYIVTVSDATTGCTATALASVTEPSVLSAGVAINHVLCNGGSDGSLDVTVSGGTGSYTFVWADGPATEDRAGLSAGAYSVVVTDANGCMVTVNATVNEPATSISINTTVVDATDVAGCDDGSATATATGGTGTLTFLWDSSPAQTTATAVNLTNGIYNVIVTDGNGCTATQSVVVDCVVECDDTVGISGVTDVLCFGESTGSATVTAGSTNNPSTTYTYAWSGPGGYSATGATITSLAAGTYTVIATPSTSCATVSESVVIDEPTAPLTLSTSSTAEQGPTTNDGTATVTPAGGTPGYTYVWTPNVSTTNTATGLDEGNYNVTVTDANGCSATATITVLGSTCNNLSVSAVGSLLDCVGDSDGTAVATATGGTGILSYSWNTLPAQGTATATNLSEGDYIVTVSDATTGCTATALASVTEPSVLSAGVAINHVLCNGGSDGSLDVTVSGGTGSYTFVWSDGPATEDRAGLSAGAYSVVVTDANGCMVTVNATVNEPATSISINTTVVNATTAAGCDDGSATATATGGTGTLTFLWDSSPAQTTATAVNLSDGIYNIIVTDGNGCTATQSVVVGCDVTCDDTVGISGVTDVLCFGESTGSATATAGSSNNPSTTYTYAWSGPGGYSATGATITSLAVGTYTVIATPSTSCATVSESVVIDEPTAILSVSATSTDESGPTTNDGTVTAVVIGGTPNYTYSWNSSPVQTTAVATGLDEGVYVVTVTDANGCTATATTIVNPGTCNNLAVTGTSIPVSCDGGMDGEVTANVTGGSGTASNLSYLWDDGSASTTQTVTGLSAGTYTVTVTDAGNSCIVTTAVTINSPSTLSAGVAISHVNCNNGSDGSLDVTVSGGTGPYTFVWSDGPATEDRAGLSAGAYSVVVTDANGCMVTVNATVNEPGTSISINTTVVNATTGAGCTDGEATAAALGGTSPYTYFWSGGYGTNALATGLIGSQSGITYDVIITDANGCSVTQSVVIGCTNTCDAVVAIDTAIAVLCKGDATGSATVSASSVANPLSVFTFVWEDDNSTIVQTTNGALTSTATNLSEGVYVVSVTIDGLQCAPVQQSVIIIEPANALSATAITNIHQQTNGGTEGQVSVNVSGGTSPYSYQWDANAGDATTATVSGLLPGTYCVVVTDDNGCMSSSTCTVVNPFDCPVPGITVTPTVTDASCNGVSDGTISLSVLGGTIAPYTYVWTGTGVVQGVANQTGLAAGIYGVTVSDGANCPVLVSGITIDEPTNLSAGVAITNVACNGDASGSLNLTVSGGTSPYTFLWNNDVNLNTEDLNNLTAGPYTVLVTDANGCQVTANGSISEPSNALSVNTSKVDATDANACSDGEASATVTGGTAPYSYIWSSGALTADVSGLLGSIGGETYNVVVTDANGCTAVQSVVINCVTTCDATVVVDTAIAVLCKGDASGSATVSASSISKPMATFTFVWTQNSTVVFTSNNTTTSTATNLAAGIYLVSVETDSTSCPIVQQNVTIIEPANTLSATAITNFHQQTNGGTEGEVTVSASGGTGPYSYLWDANAGNATTPTVSGLLPGLYCVVATDTNGCSAASVCTQVNDFTCSSSPQVSVTVVDVSCSNGTNGMINLSITGGNSPYTFAWIGTGTIPGNQNQTNLSAGVYSVTVTDNTNCPTIVSGITIDEPAPLSSGIAITNIPCSSGNIGNLNLTVAGGSQPYSFSWDNGQITEDIDNLDTGLYVVTITDVNACVLIDSARISRDVPTDLTNGDVTTTPIIGCGDCNGTLTLHNLETGVFYSVTYVNSSVPGDQFYNGTTTFDSLTITGICPGDVVITSILNTETGCESNVTNPLGPFNFMDAGNVSIDNIQVIQQPTVCGACDGIIDIVGGSITNQTLYDVIYTYEGIGRDTILDVSASLNGGGIARLRLSNLCPGSYTNFSIIDPNGCESPLEQGPYNLENPDAPVVDFITPVDASNCGLCDGELQVTLDELGTGPYTITYSLNGSPVTTSTLSATAGVITVTDLCPGTYSNISVNGFNGCSSMVVAGPYVIGEPSELLYGGLESFTNPSVCNVCDGTIVLDSLTPFEMYEVSYNSTSFTGPANGGGQITLSSLCADVYSFITVRQISTGCISGSIPDVILMDPNAPVVASVINVVDPSGCNALDGSFTLTSFVAGSYTVEYEYNGAGGSSFSATVGGSGNLIVTGLDDGAYTNIVVISSSGCESLPFLGPVVLTDPTPALGSAGPDEAFCLTSDYTLEAQIFEVDVVVTWRRFSNGSILNPGNPNSITQVVSPTDNTCYVAQFDRTSTGCTFYDTVCLNVSKTPQLALEPNCFDVDEDASLTLSILNDVYANDDMTDIYGPGTLNANLNITVIDDVDNGILTVNEALDQIVYTPYADYNGPDTLFYQVCNADCPGALFCDSSYLCFNVIPVNDPPIAIIDFNNTVVNVPVSGTVLTNDFDIDGDDLTVTLISQTGTNGTVATIDPLTGDYTYTPIMDAFGTDTLVYSICDGGTPDLCDTTLVIIEVIDFDTHPTANNAPVANPDGYVGVQGTPVTSTLMSNDFDPDGDTITLTSNTQPTDGVVTIVDATTGEFIYTPNDPNFVGTDEFTYVICDDQTPALCDTTVATIDILPLGNPTENNPPTGVDDGYYTYQGLPFTSNIEENDFDVDGDNITFTVLEDPTNGDLTGAIVDPTTGEFTYTPDAGYTGPDQFTYEVCDDGTPVLCDTATAYITIIFANLPPIATNDINNGNVNQTVEGDVSTNDTEPDNDPVVFTVITPPSVPGVFTFDVDSGTYSYTPPADFVGNVEFEYSICDDANPSLCDTALVTINIEDVDNNPFGNNPPVASNDNYTTYGDSPVDGEILSNDFDPDMDNITLNVTPITDPTNGSVTVNPDGTFTYSPVAGFEGQDEFTYSICDDGVPVLCDTATVVIDVLPELVAGANEPPVTVDDAYGTDNETPIIGDVTINDILPADGDDHIVTLISDVDEGDLVLSDNGTFIYTPGQDDEISTSFVYSVCDNGTPIACDTATAVILVWDANQPPLAVNDINNTFVNTPVTGDVSTNDTEPDGDDMEFTFTSLPDPLTEGTLTWLPDGTYTFVPATDFTGQVEATYVVCDDNTTNLIDDFGCDTAILVINVEDYTPGLTDNHPPVANDDNFVVNGTDPVTSTLLSNDFDIDEDDLVVNTTPLSGPTSGSVVINPDGTFTFTPDTTLLEDVMFTYEICDDVIPALCDTATVTITVLEPIDSVSNDPPVAGDDYYSIDDESGPLTGNALDNDIDPNDDNMTVTLVGAPDNGTIILLPDGSFTYVPFNGTTDEVDVIDYIVCDDGNPILCDAGQIFITVNDNDANVNEPPVAVEDVYSTLVDQQVSGNTLDNDIEPENETLTTDTITGPTFGELVPPTANGVFTYTPDPGFVGVDMYTYYICDPLNQCDTTTVTINVIAPEDSTSNIPPFATDDAFAGGINDSIVGNIILNDLNPDLDALTVDTITSPMNGTITSFDPTTGIFTYEPNQDYYGPDNFIYVLCDNGAPVLCDTATVSILIYNDNLPPIAVDDINNTLINTPVDGNVGTNDLELDGDDLTFTLVDTILPTQGTLTFDSLGNYTFTPDSTVMPGDVVTFTYSVCDDFTPELCDTAEVVISIDDYNTDENNSPIANNDNVVVPSTDPVTICAICNDNDPDTDDVITATLIPTGVNVTDNGDGTFTVIPDPLNYDTIYTFEYSICDDGTPVLCDTATVNVTIIPEPEDGNEPPFAVDDSYTAGLNDTITDFVELNDILPTDGDTHTFAQISTASNGTVISFDFNTGEFIYVADEDYYGPDNFTYVVCDDATPVNACDTATVYITIVNDNLPPLAIDDINNTLVETPVSGDVSTNDSEPEGDAVVFAVVDDVDPTEGVLVFNPDGTYTFTPDSTVMPGDVVTFTYSVCDDFMPSLCDTAEVVISIDDFNIDENNPPVANNDNVVTTNTNPITINAIANDNDPDTDDVITATLIPTTVNVTDNGDGTFTVIPDPLNDDTVYTFMYSLCDDGSPVLCDTATVTVTVIPEPEDGNEPPFAVDDSYVVGLNDTITDVVELNDILPTDGDTHTFTLLDDPMNGDVTAFDPTTGEFTYEADMDYYGPDNFTYVVCDDATPVNACDTATVYITIFNDNMPPLAIDDINNTLVETPVSGDVSTNDSEPEGDAVVFAVVDDVDPTEGVLVFNPDGTYTFTPDSTVMPGDVVTFTYSVCDDFMPPLCDTAEVVISIDDFNIDENNPPVANNDNVVTTNTNPITINAIANDNDPDTDDVITATLIPTTVNVTDNGDGTFTVIPDPLNDDTVYTFMYSLCDDGSPVLCDTATVTVTVIPEPEDGNEPPFAVDDSYVVGLNDSITDVVELNDILPTDGDTHTFTLLDDPMNGDVTAFDPTTGEFTYEADMDYYGPDNFTYVVCDDATPVNACDTATVYITIFNDNMPPLAIDDINNTLVETPVSGDVSTNDSEPEDDTVVFAVVDDVDPTEGVLVFNPDGTYTFTPDSTVMPGDVVTFTYSVCDDFMPPLCDTAEVVISIDDFNIDENNPPVANNDNVVVPNTDPIDICVICNDNDPDPQDSITVTEVIAPIGTPITLNPDGTVTVTPVPGVTDTTYTFDYVICDDGTPVLCDTATANITVSPEPEDGNEPPFAVDDSYVVGLNDSITDVVELNDILPTDGDTHTFTLLDDPMNGDVTAFDPTTGEFTYEADMDYYGPDNFTYVVCDDATPVNACDTATVYITIFNDNMPPLAIDDINNTLVETPVSGDVSTNDSEPEDDTVVFAVVDDVDPTEGVLVFNPDGTYTFTPDSTVMPGDVVTFTYSVCDDFMPSLCDTAEVVISIDDSYVTPGTNNPPVANNDNVVVPNTDPIDLCVICNDFDPNPEDTITVTEVIAPIGTPVTLNPDGTVTVTPVPGVTDTTYTFEYVVCDNGNPVLCDTATASVTVGPELVDPLDNVPPFAVDDSYGTIGDEVTASVLDNDILPNDGDIHTVQVVTDPSNGTVTSFDPNTGVFTYVPNEDYGGPDNFTYVLCDNASPVNNCDTATVYITVFDANSPPIAVNDVNHTFNDLPVSGDVSTNDFDPNGDDVVFDLVDDVDPTEGTLEFNPDGTYTFTPEPGSTGTVTFTYTICETLNLESCDTATVTIDVDTYDPSENNEPVAVDDNILTYGDPVNPPTVDVCVVCNDSEPDNDPVTITVIDTPDNGTLVDNGDGTFTYTPDPGFEGDDDFTYVLCDDGNPELCDSATVTITVLPTPTNNVNLAPFATDDHYSTGQDEPITTSNITDNDINLDNDNLTVALVTEPTNGTLTQNADGTFEYVPNTGFAGEDQYTYVLCDDGSPVLCDTATVYITINPDNVIAEDDEVTVTNNDPIDIEVLENDTFSTGTPIINIVSDPLAGTVSVNNDGTITYIPNIDPSIPVDSFQYVLCSNTICDTAWIYVNTPLIVIPDGFSPGADGINDFFVIEDLLKFYPDATVGIYNRWGDEVWNSYGPYQNNWDGTNMQDTDLPDGTYFYILDFNSEDAEAKQGFVAIYRNR